MLIFILAVVSLLISCGLLCFSERHDKPHLSLISFLFVFVFSIACVIMFIAFIVSRINSEANVEKMIIQRESYVYQLENKIYEDGLIGKKVLYDQITNFNTILNTRKIMSQNIWVSMFYPSVYDDIDPICFDIISEEDHD